MNERRRIRLAADPLRHQLIRDVSAARADATLARGRIENRGRILAVSLLDLPQGLRAYVVVRETNLSSGVEAIGSTSVRVYRASLKRRRGGWLVSGWRPLQ